MALDGEATTRIAVDVTFLQMDMPPSSLRRALPDGWELSVEHKPEIAFYRMLYNGVGHNYCWWLRRVAPDVEIKKILDDPAVSLHVLRHGGVVAGFFELDARCHGDVNLAYFGLLPHAIGMGVGKAFLDAALAEAWSRNPSCVRVNTCTADHPRALGTYIDAGFQVSRVVAEIWDIPDRLGLPIPERLRY